jgi:glycosyltransferase involved in cell wall biosynthesis
MFTQQSNAQGKMAYQSSDLPKIAYLLNSFPCLSETFIVQEILELECQGLPLHLFALSEPSVNKQAEGVWDGQAPITYISRHSRLTLLAIALRRFLRTPWRFLRTVIIMVAHYRRGSVLGHLLYAAYLADQLVYEGIPHLHAHYATTPASVAQLVHLLTGISYSFTAHAHDIYLSPKDTLAYKMRTARFVVTCTAYNERYLAGIDLRFGTHIHCIYHGLNLRIFPSHASIASLPLASPLILAVGRLVEKKGLSYLLRASRILKDQGYNFTCRIVGDGPLRQVLEAEMRELDLIDKVEMWGAASHKQVIEMYQQATIAALPCIIGKNGDRDGIPNVLVEALYMGVAVVSTPISGIPELITSEVSGLLVPPQDSTALAIALARLLDDTLLRCRFAAAGRETVLERFDMARNTIRLLHLLCADEGDRHDE